MRALVVYESMFGNTRAVAEAVAAGIATAMPVEVVEVGQAPALATLSVDLLVVGAPTHAFGLSRPQTRRDAADRGGGTVISAGTGVREWLDVDADDLDLQVASFDTHVKKPNLPGWAGHGAQKRLRGLGCRVVTKAESFFVNGYQGPLLPGELERAQEWGAGVAALAGRRATT